MRVTKALGGWLNEKNSKKMSVKRATGEGERKIARQPENKPDLIITILKVWQKISWRKTRAVKKSKSYVESLKCFSLVNRNKIFDYWLLSLVGVTSKWVPDFHPKGKKKVYSFINIEWDHLSADTSHIRKMRSITSPPITIGWRNYKWKQIKWLFSATSIVTVRACTLQGVSLYVL